MDDESDRTAEDEARSRGEPLAHELTHVAQQGPAGATPEGAPGSGSGSAPETLGEDVAHVVESAAELGLGAVIAPWTGGETVDIIGSVASMFEAGVDRLTHLGEHESAPVSDAPVDGDPGRAPDDRPE
jgi:hypothetical protein